MSRSLPIEFLGGIFCCIAFAALITFVIVRLLEGSGHLPGQFRQSEIHRRDRQRGVKTTLGKDGFWIRGNRLRRGSQVRYRYFVDNEPMDGTITYEPELRRTFCLHRPHSGRD